MTGRQRMLLGFFVGGVITLLAFAPSRSVLLHVLHRPAVDAAMSRSVLSSPPGPLPEPGFAGKMDLPEVSRQMLLISKRIYRDPNATISARDYEIALEYLRRGEALENDNSYWPQLRAAVGQRAGRGEPVWTSFNRAAEKRYWSSGSTQEMIELWRGLADAEGLRMSWQGLLVRELRADDPANLILELDALAPKPEDLGEEAWRQRYLLAWNFSLLRDGARSVDVTQTAASSVLRLSDAFVDPRSDRTPMAIETARTFFTNEMRRILGPVEEDRTAIAIRNSIAREVSIQPSDMIIEQRDMIELRSILNCALPSVLFVSGLLLGGMALIGLLISNFFGEIPHPDPRFMAVLAVVSGVAAGVSSGAWLFGLWIFFAVAVLATPIEAASPSDIDWNRLNRLALGTLSSIAMILIAAWVFASGPSAILAMRTLPFATPLLENPDGLGILAIVALTFVGPAAVLWAHIKRRPVLRVLGEAYVRIGVTGASLSITAAVILTPVTIYYDATLSATVQRWVVNETDAFRIAPQ